ncbi:hypothetical protein DL770_006917 [Monosporascus sp. CRB-9-2]|nr:hypothetical protein DL770_006917 [Monosporascus sp. CRB-9-2]
MASSTSLRAVFAYASHFMAQLPQTDFTILNPLSVFGSKPTFDSAFSIATQEYPSGTSASSCPLDGPVSCHNNTPADACCFIYPGGRLLLTQFWDEKLHVGGAETDWTLHGLWPDQCDGSYDQYCGITPQFDNITNILESFGQSELLDSMNRYWIAKYGTNDHLWAHEYNKHAACINTLAPSCYGENYRPGSEVVDYFLRAFGLFRMLDTYRALDIAGIEPDYRKKYPVSRVQSALEAYSGGRVILRCTGRHNNVLHEAWYVYFVKGSLQSGDFIPAKDSFDGDKGNCAVEMSVQTALVHRPLSRIAVRIRGGYRYVAEDRVLEHQS